MSQKPFPVLETRRLRLRAIKAAEAPTLTDISYYDGKAARSPGEAMDMLRRIHEDYEAGQTIHWGLELKAEARLIGTCGFYRGFAHQEGEIGYVLLPAYRGQGLMREAVRAVLDYGFREMGLYRIVAYTSHDNVASIRLLQETGFDRALDRPDVILVKFVFHNPYQAKDVGPMDDLTEMD